MLQKDKFSKGAYLGTAIMGGLLFLISVLPRSFDSDTRIGIQTASASNHLGIVGQQAPALNLTNWIDGYGKGVEAIELSDYRGKVVYLYFWQDW